MRKAQQQQSRAPPPPMPKSTTSTTMTENVSKNTGAPVSRSASRYHRPRTAVAPKDPESAIPSVPAVGPQKINTTSKPGTSATMNSPKSPELPLSPPPVSELAPPVIAPRSVESSERLQASIPLGEQRYRPTLQERQERMRAAQLAEWEALGRQAEDDRLRQEESRVEREEQEERERQDAIEAERRRLEEEQRRKQQEEEERPRQLREQEEAARAMAERRKLKKDTTARPADIKVIPQAKLTNPATSPTFMSFFKRRRGEDTPRSPEVSPPTTTESRPKTSHVPATKLEEETIRPGGGGIVPLADAPISAVNHGERRVMVECGKSSIRLPIDPTTTPIQLIRSASNVLSEPIDPRAAVIYEIFLKANVQRKLRMYEHVRDVMNSWDNDDQHTLIIVPTHPDSDPELYSHNAPKSEPAGGSWEMHYSNKRGKWDKRLITLRQDGQMVQSKSGKKSDEVNICHLSDYDIYELIPKLKEKKVKPPKKYCYGVKSQQKSGIFLTSTNFIHMFSTNDAKAAESFYRSIQAWRSWYLVDVMGEGGQGKAVNTNLFSDNLGGNVKPGAGKAAKEGKGHGRSLSADSHYLLGSFNDLGIDASQFRYSSGRMSQDLERANLSRSKSQRRKSVSDDDKPLGLDFPASMISRGNKESASAMHARKLSQRAEEKRSPPVSYLAHTVKASQDSGVGPPRTAQSQSSGEVGTFAAGGLLGSDYDRRKDALAPSGNTNAGLKRTDSVRSSRSRRHSISNGDAAGGLARRESVRRGIPDKPLVDLTPQYKEPPQFTKKGHAYRPAMVGEGGLINAVPDNMNIEEKIKIPSSTSWKRPTTSSGASASAGAGGPSRYRSTRSHAVPPSTGGGAGYDRTKSLRGHGAHRAGASAGEAGAFTGDGLLAHSKAGWGAGGRGHGVMRGSEAKGPMVNLKEESEFASGSLLRQAEQRGAWSQVPQ